MVSFKGTVEVKDGNLVVNGKKIRVTAEKNPADLKWDEVGAEYVVESTGLFLDKGKMLRLILMLVQRKLLCRLLQKMIPQCLLWVLTKKSYTKDMNFVSNASCTTNCLAPIAKVIK